MAFIKTKMTDEETGKKSDLCFNTEHIVTMLPARSSTILIFTDGQKLLVDIPYQALARHVGAKDKLD